MTSCPDLSRPLTALPRTLAASLGALALLAGAARASDSTEIEQTQRDIQVGAEAKKGVNFLVVPLPQVDPALGEGGTLVTAAFYKPVKGGRQWLTGVGAMYTSHKNYAFGVAQQADLLGGRLRLSGFGGYGNFNLEFFGQGEAAGSAGRSVVLNEKGLAAIANGLFRVWGPLYVGGRYRYLDLTSKVADPVFPDLPLPAPAQLRTVISGLGPSVEIDTRDEQFTPHKGTYVAVQWVMSREGLGSDFSYNKLNASLNRYQPLGNKTVLALRGSVCTSGRRAPFYDVCMFGMQNDLRGYQGGQYRDFAMFAVQAELRRQLFGRFGAVAFGGVGKVAPSFGDFGEARALPAGGLGLRFRPARKIPVNVSVDYAWGRDSQGLYLYVGEAF